MSEIERIAEKIAHRVYHFTEPDKREELKNLLIEFAFEIKRSAIEP